MSARTARGGVASARRRAAISNTITDTFTGSTLSTQWVSGGDSGSTATDLGGRLVLTPPNTAWSGSVHAVWAAMPAVTNTDLTGTFYFPTVKQQWDIVAIRAYDTQNGYSPISGYALEVFPGDAGWAVSRWVDGTQTSLSGNQSFTFPAATDVKYRFSAQGAVISVKLWTGATEPGAWTWTTTDATPYLVPGRVLTAASNGGDPTHPVHFGPMTVVSADAIPAALSLANTSAPYGGPSGAWSQVFNDDFTGTTLDTTKWVALDGWTMNNVTTRAVNVTVASSELRLRLSDATTGAYISTEPAAGAGVNAYQLTVGDYAEARVWFPGNGTQLYNWSAWWASGPSWPTNGETDIAEILGDGGDLTINYHYGTDAGAGHQSKQLGAPTGYWGDQFHVYGAHRRTGRTDVYWDGRLVRSFTTSDNGQPQSLLLNVGAGAAQMTGAAGDLRVDWVRAWRPS